MRSAKPLEMKKMAMALSLRVIVFFNVVCFIVLFFCLNWINNNEDTELGPLSIVISQDFSL